jgi:hypothetical protein
MIARQRFRPIASRVLLVLATLCGASLLFASAVRAAPATVGPVVISVPDGFEAAQTQKSKRSVVSAWTKSSRAAGLKTLLQINVIDFGSRPGTQAPDQDLIVYAEEYLRQFLSGVALRRTGYVSSPVAHIRLADLPAARASWNGAVAGRPTVGVMYSVIVRNRFAVIFHTQDLGSTPSSGMLEAMKAIDSVKLAGME